MKERPILFSGPMVRALLEGRKTQTRRVVKEQPNGSAIAAHHADGLWYFTSGFRRIDSLTSTNGVDPAGRRCPYGQPGDRLWVRETWGFRGRQLSGMDKANALTFIQYQADGARSEIVRDWDDESGLPKQRDRNDGETSEKYDRYLTAFWRSWRPSIHMPRWASRLTLEVTEVRVQRLQEMSEEDARSEGVERLVEENGWRNYGAEDLPGESVRYWATARESFQSLWGSINGKRPGCTWGAGPWVWCVSFRRVS